MKKILLLLPLTLLLAGGCAANNEGTVNVLMSSCKESIQTTADSWDALTNSYTCSTSKDGQFCQRVELDSNGGCNRIWNYDTYPKTTPTTTQPTSSISTNTNSLTSSIPQNNFAPSPVTSTSPSDSGNTNQQNNIIIDKNNYSEGWMSPGSGWAYDNDKDYSLALTFRSVNNPAYTFTATSSSSVFNNPAHDVGGGCGGECYQDGSFLWMLRPDAASALNNKDVAATKVIGFQFTSWGFASFQPDIPKDDYTLIKATYNGNAFSLAPNTDTVLFRVCAFGHNNISECGQ